MVRYASLVMTIFIAFVMALGFFLPVTPSAVYAADAKTEVCQGLSSIGGDNCTAGSGGQLNSLLTALLNMLSVVAGVAAVIAIIIAGFKYIMSAGDPSGVTSAKNALLYAIIGIVVVAFAQVIVKFVLARAG